MTKCLATAVAVICVSALSACGAATAGSKSHPTRTASLGTAVESTDPDLAHALLAERLLPSAEAHLQVAREYFRLQVLDTAQARVERALARDPRLAAAHDLNARIYREWGQPAAALTHAHRALYFAPGSGSSRNTLGTILMALGRFAEARAAFLEAAAVPATAAWALSNACYLEFRRGNLGEARRRCEEAVKVDPTFQTAHNNLGLVHAATGNLQGGHDAFLAGGDPATASFNLGVVHLAARRYSDAAAAFAIAAEIRPGFTAAKSRAHEARMLALRDKARQER